jgi:hypothetical protein
MVLKDSAAFYCSFAFALSLVYLRYETVGGGGGVGLHVRGQN